MAVFIGVHKMPGPVDETQILNGWAKYKEAATGRGLRPIRVHYNPSLGTAYCATEAPSADGVKEAHEEIGLPPQEIIEVKTLE